MSADTGQVHSQVRGVLAAGPGMWQMLSGGLAASLSPPSPRREE